MLNNLSNNLEGKKDACKTYIEQTKLLVTLSSTFVIAPAAARQFIKDTSLLLFVFAEICFIISVLMGYFVMGSISGSQQLNEYNVYRKATMNLSRLQLGFYLIGLILFIIMVIN